MAEYNITNCKVFPTENDVTGGGSPGAGRIHTEENLAGLTKMLLGGQGWVFSGFTLPSSGALTQAIAVGEAVIDGYWIKGTGNNTVTFSASTTNHVYLRLIYTSSKVVQVEHDINTTGTAPSNSIKLGTVTTNGSAVTSSVDMRPSMVGVMRGTYTGDGTNNRTITVAGLNVIPTAVVIQSISPVGVAFGFRGLSSTQIGFVVSATAAKASSALTDRPLLVAGGFQVDKDGTTVNLNGGSIDYLYLILC